MSYTGGKPFSFYAVLPFIGLGFLLALIACIFSAVCKKTGGRRLRFALDIILCLAATVSTHLAFVAVNRGKIRFYPLLAQALGAAVCFLSVGPFAQRLTLAVFGVIKRGVSALLSPLAVIFGKIKKLVAKISAKIKKSLKNP